MQTRIQVLGANGEQPLHLDKDSVKNREALLQRAKGLNREVSLGELTKGDLRESSIKILQRFVTSKIERSRKASSTRVRRRPVTLSGKK